MRPPASRRTFAVFVAVLVLLTIASTPAAAQSGIGGSVVVEEGETVSEVNAVGGSVIVHGTVTGDVSGAAGNVLVTGTVEGDVNVATGNLVISGTVGGSVSAGAGSVHIAESGLVNGNVDIGAGDVRIDGTIGGDARIGAETIRLGDTATIDGSLTYDGQLEGNLDAVAGEITHDRALGATDFAELQPLVSWVFAVYAFIANLVLGVLLLAVFPRFSDGIAEQAIGEPLKTGLVGFGVLLAVPLLASVLVLTIVGIPLALVGALVFLFAVWIAVVYGRFALGMWLLSFVGRSEGDRSNRRWIALLLGLLLGAALAAVPVVGDAVRLVLFLLGLGALTLRLAGYRRGTSVVESSAD